MRVRIAESLCLLLFAASAVSCGTPSQPGPSAGATGGGSSRRQPGRGREDLGGVTNPFPHDTRQGSVPQQRGADLRPASRKPATAGRSSTALAAAPGAPSTLILYDDGGLYGWLGELYGIAAGQLASHFGTWQAKPIAQYQAGDLAGFSAAIYVGSTYDEPVPVAFLDDVLAAGARPVVWIYDNIWQLANRAPDFFGSYGFNPGYFDTATVGQVVYKGTTLTRYVDNGAGIMVHSALDPSKASELASAARADGTTFPWAIRSGNLTYIGENPFAYIYERDRYLAFCDLLFDLLAPDTAERHRALVRIEDVTPIEDPAALRAVADYLAAEQVPFSVAVVPVYTDPNGVYGPPETIRMRDAPQVVSALNYMVSKGGNLVLHGYTHQYSSLLNPYSGVSADDFEFWMSNIDAVTNNVVLVGPVLEDSESWAAGRVADGLAELAAAGLPRPQIFEFPHYAASGVDARAVRANFDIAYHRGLYFKGALTGLPDDTGAGVIGQFFPYTVTDVYGWKMIPENDGNYEPEAANNNPPRLPADIVGNAQADLVVRDGIASFYFHPYYPLSALTEIVTGYKQAGYTFVSPLEL